MTAFELLVSLFVGVVAGFVLAVAARWRHLGPARAAAGGALGGVVGALVGHPAFALGETWGELRFHPALAVCSLAGGLTVVAVLQLLGDAHSRRRRSGRHRAA